MYAHNSGFIFGGDSSVVKFFGVENNVSIKSLNGVNTSLISKRQIDLTGNIFFYCTTNLQTDYILYGN